MLKLKLQYFGHVIQRAYSLEKTDSGKDWGQEEKGVTEDENVGWHHQLHGHEFEETVKDREAWCAVLGLQRFRHDLAIEQQEYYAYLFLALLVAIYSSSKRK